MKRTLALIFALVLVVSIAGGCASAPAPSASTPAASTPAASTPAESTPAASTPAASTPVTQPTEIDPNLEVWKIGNFTYLTGANAQLGAYIQNGAQLAIDYANEEGGILGHKLELVSYDDAALPDNTTQVVNRMINEDKVIAIVGSSSTAPIRAAMEFTEPAGMLLCGGSPSPTYTDQGYKYTFRSYGSLKSQYKAMADVWVEQGYKSVSILSINTEYGQAGAQTAADLASAAGIEVLATEYYDGTKDLDYTAQITNMLAGNPDGIFLNCSSAAQMLIAARNLETQGWDGYVWGTESCGGPEFRDAGDVANGFMFATTDVIPQTIEDAGSELEKRFLTDYVERWGEMPVNDVAYRAFDGASIIIRALRDAGGYEDKEAVSAALWAISDYQGIIGHFDYTSGTGNGFFDAEVYAIDGNINIPMDEYKANADITQPYAG
jgi:branched-chain amino acid transport system substrate-binding protein